MDGKVYIIIQSWQIQDDSGLDILSVYESREKAIERLKAEYEQDVVWLSESKNCYEEDFDENYCKNTESFVSKNESYSKNEITEKYLIK